MFIVLEGTHGAGKSTVARILSTTYGFGLFKTPPIEYEPIRSYIHNQAGGLSRFLYYLAGIADVSSKIRAFRNTDKIVCDRYYPSTIAACVTDYNLDVKTLLSIITLIEEHIEMPDKFFLLTASHINRMDRLKERITLEPDYQTNPDSQRIKQLEDIHLRYFYSPDRWEIIETDSLTSEQVAEIIAAQCKLR